MKGFELIYAYLDQNSIRYCPPDKEVYEEVCKIEEELRKTKHALWMARAYNGLNTTYNLTSYHTYMIEHPNTKVTSRRWYHCWKTVERKCLDKAKEFE